MGPGEAQAWLGEGERGGPGHAERRWWAATSWEGRVGLPAWQGHFTVRTVGANTATASREAAERLAGPAGGREGRPGRCRVRLGP